MRVSDQHPDDEIDLMQIVAVLLEEWRLIAAITGGAIVLSIIVALNATPMYRAQATLIEISDSGRASVMGQLGGLAAMAGFNTYGQSDSARRARALLRSRALSEEFIRRNALIPFLYPESEEPPTLWKATNDFMNGVWSVNEDVRTGLITVSIAWTDSHVAAEWVNGMVALANEVLRRHDIVEAERSIEYLTNQAAQTSLVGLQQAIFNLIEAETRTLTFANVREEYAFSIIDPAVAPEMRFSPRRTMMVILGAMLGGLLSLLVVAARRVALNFRRA